MHSPTPGHRAYSPAPIAFALISFAAIFAADLFLPHGENLPLLYVVVIVLGSQGSGRRYPHGAAAGASVLTIIGALDSPAAGVLWSALANRTLDIAVFWLCAVLVGRYMRLREEHERTIERSLRDLADIKYAIDQAAIVATTDTLGRIRYVNDKFCEISQYSREELIGQDHRIINSGYHPKEFIRNLWLTIANGEIWRGEIRNRAKDGSFYWVDTTIVPFLDEQGKPYQYLAIRSDITERKRAQQQLQEQTTLARLGQMAAVVAHEVRNPLAGIRGALQVICTRLPGESRDRAIIGDIVARLDSLNDIVGDLLLFARPRMPRTTPVDVRALIDGTTVLLRKDPAFSGVVLEVRAEPLVIQADAEQLQIVLLNVLLNAAQATEAQGRIEVVADIRDGRCVIQVRDNGPGISAEVRDTIFEPFVTTKHRGTGLGLPIAKRVVDMHRGTIMVDCPPSGGTIVTIDLPVEA